MTKKVDWEELRNSNDFRTAVYEFAKPITKTVLKRLTPFKIPFVEESGFLQETEPIFNCCLYLEQINPNAKIPHPIRNEVKKIISQVLEENNINEYCVSITGKVIMWSIHNVDKMFTR